MALRRSTSERLLGPGERPGGFGGAVAQVERGALGGFAVGGRINRAADVAEGLA
jgi:hypothetical protein